MKVLLPLLATLTFSTCGERGSGEPSPAPPKPADTGAKGGLTPDANPGPELADNPPATNTPMPKREKYKPETDEELRARLTELQYDVTKHEATEARWTNKYDKHFEEGIYVCIISGEPLFSSKDKYDSGCGWPAFTKPIETSEIEERTDYKIGYARTEVRAKTGDSHLGHVFPDGPQDKGGMRYCINSASIRFVPKDKLAEEGYGEYLALFSEGGS